jgi:hypothetical protein
MTNIREVSFVPLTPTGAPAAGRPDSHVKVLSPTEGAPAFQALGRSQTSAAQTTGCEPRVTLQRDEDRISAIRIQCTCGQTIELTCVYDPATAPDAATPPPAPPALSPAPAPPTPPPALAAAPPPAPTPAPAPVTEPATKRKSAPATPSPKAAASRAKR